MSTYSTTQLGDTVDLDLAAAGAAARTGDRLLPVHDAVAAEARHLPVGPDVGGVDLVCVGRDR